jgi:superfamily I DNA/RNA helicase
LFLAADPTQGFLRRRQSWLASGIDVRGGRTTRLSQAYRNSRRILQFAKEFIERRTPEEDAGEGEGLNIPSDKQIAAIEVEGVVPEIVCCAGRQDLQKRVANEVKALVDASLPPGQVLILAADGSANALGQVIGKVCRVHDAKDRVRPAEAFCQISTLNAATGLEAPIVFVLGLEKMLERERAPTLSPDERQELRRDNTRQLYMAFTRAGQRLVILTTNQGVAEELRTIADGLPPASGELQSA